MSTVVVQEVKQLQVKTKSAQRLHKELASYQKEKDKEQARVDKMKEEGAETSDLKQAEQVLQESIMMIPQTRQRLENALQDLESFLAGHLSDVKGHKEEEEARETIAAVTATLQGATA